MKRYKIELRGKNFLLNFTGEPRKFGFHATRFLKANSPKEAEKMAIIMVRQTPELRKIVSSEKTDQPEITLISIQEINSVFFLLKQSSSQLVFHAEEEEQLSLP